MTTSQALQYVKNTNGGATVENFIEDWSPIGSEVWDSLLAKGYVTIRDGKIYLTTIGEKML
jgi:hypothetical protein